MLASDSNNSIEATGRVLEKLAKTSNNAEFLANLSKD